ncbi:tyrosine-type recombinase/integrase [Candidatus Peregrinibacteria bacterium]|nr:MAG: tyrosine-type recombinase/integrase [Candidatus Peregrinibacteria bacterium]
MFISDAIQQFLEHCEIEKNQSKRTLISYQHYLERFLGFADDIELDQITLNLVKKFRLHLNRYEFKPKETLSVKTQNYHMIALRAFLKFCAKNDWNTLAPEKVDLSKIEERTVEYLTRDELERLFEAVDIRKITGLRNRAILEMLYSTGLRISELVNLDRGHVNLERGEFHVRGKGQKVRIVFLSKRAIEWIKEYLNERDDGFDPLFLNHGRTREKDPDHMDLKGEHRRLTAYSIQEMVRTTALLAGITKHVTPHTLRHSFATELLLNGADIRSVQDMLGHASITTTQIYTHITNSKLREIHEKFHR